MAPATEAPPAHRETCYRCWKPRVTCVCDLITPVANRTFVTVLQHPRERAHPIGTARFVELGLQRSEVVVALSQRARPPRPPLAAARAPRSSTRTNTRATSRRCRRASGRSTSSSSTARGATRATLYRQNPWLADLPHVQLAPTAPSRYRIRREPRADYVSTLEAVLESLRILEPETEGLEGLLRAFDALVDTQLEHAARARAGRGAEAPEAGPAGAAISRHPPLARRGRRSGSSGSTPRPISPTARRAPRSRGRSCASWESASRRGSAWTSRVLPAGGVPDESGAPAPRDVAARTSTRALTPEELARALRASSSDRGSSGSPGTAARRAGCTTRRAACIGCGSSIP